jgi:hypothetical protein
MTRSLYIGFALVVALILIGFGISDLVAANLLGVIAILLGFAALAIAIEAGRKHPTSIEDAPTISRVWARGQERGLIATTCGLIGIVFAILIRSDLVVALLIFVTAFLFLVAGLVTLIATRRS